MMQAEGYKKHSHGQYDVHNFSRDLLLESANRVLPSVVDRPFRLVDLGAADGTNSMNTLQFLIDSIEQKPLSVHLTVEEHPQTDEAVLRSVLESHNEWFQSHNINYDVLMKSFYEPLFEKDSVDMFLSYICLHWLDTSCAPAEGISSWKKFGGNTETNFVFSQENGVPEAVLHHWRDDLARPHLAKFIGLRAQELRVGGEMVLVMVGTPFSWLSLPRGSVLTEAVQRCIDRGEVNADLLQNAIVPYYLRSLCDVEDAVALCNTQLDGDGKVEVMGTRMIPLNLGKGAASDMDTAFSMLWSIHQGTLRTAGATDEEMKLIRSEASLVNKEHFDLSDGIEATYLACVLRRSV